MHSDWRHESSRAHRRTIARLSERSFATPNAWVVECVAIAGYFHGSSARPRGDLFRVQRGHRQPISVSRQGKGYLLDICRNVNCPRQLRCGENDGNYRDVYDVYRTLESRLELHPGVVLDATRATNLGRFLPDESSEQARTSSSVAAPPRKCKSAVSSARRTGGGEKKFIFAERKASRHVGRAEKHWRDTRLGRGAVTACQWQFGGLSKQRRVGRTRHFCGDDSNAKSFYGFYGVSYGASCLKSIRRWRDVRDFLSAPTMANI